MQNSYETRVTCWSILGSALRILAARWRPLVRALLLPACVLTLLGTLKPHDQFPISILYSFAELVVGASFAIVTHRIILLGLDLSPWATLAWSRRETRFAIWWFATNILLIPSIALYAARDLIESVDANVFFAIISLAAVVLAARLSLVLPALAIDDPAQIRRIWALSRGRVVHLTMALGGTTLGTTALWLSLPEDSVVMQLATMQVLLGLAACATIVIQLAVLSASYRELEKAAA